MLRALFKHFMQASITVTGLFYYPIKSCKGIELQSAELDECGIKGDRSLMIVTPEGRFLTQRDIPAMARIQPDLNLATQTLCLSAPTMETLTITISDKGTPENRIKTAVWGTDCDAVVQDSEANEWLSSFLKQECRLVTMEQGFKRIVDQEYATSPTDHTGFADGYNILLASEESLEALNNRLFDRGSGPVPMNRFRPNIVVKGTEAFGEDTWSDFSINSVAMRGVKPCGRCIVTTIDQDNGTRTGKEPVATLNTFRKSADGHKILFGQNVINREQGIINVGDAVILA
jgi:hypothetical protein